MSYQPTQPLWKQGKNGNRYQHANLNRLEAEEPDTFRLLELKAGFRANDGIFMYFVNHHDKYGWSVARTALYERNKDTTDEQSPEQDNEKVNPVSDQDKRLTSSANKPLELKTAEQLLDENARRANIRVKFIDFLQSHLDFLNENIFEPEERYRLVPDYEDTDRSEDKKYS